MKIILNHHKPRVQTGPAPPVARKHEVFPVLACHRFSPGAKSALPCPPQGLMRDCSLPPLAGRGLQELLAPLVPLEPLMPLGPLEPLGALLLPSRASCRLLALSFQEGAPGAAMPFACPRTRKSPAPGRGESRQAGLKGSRGASVALASPWVMEAPEKAPQRDG